eukprot:m.11096 g.11096  ORF g.11096 m.11096 type:complete len:1028 (-) comp4375_c0_seq1:1442-4525(-)
MEQEYPPRKRSTNKLKSEELAEVIGQPLSEVTCINLSEHNLDAVDKLTACQKLNTLILRRNFLTKVPRIDACRNLWNIDLSCNRIDYLEGFSRFSCLGSILLNGNLLTWNEIFKLRHIQILNLSLQDNPIHKDPNYREHVVDICSKLWSLDGRIITTAERSNVKQHFDAVEHIPHLRRKRPRTSYMHSTLRNVEVTGLIGNHTVILLKRFPSSIAQTLEVDRLRLLFIAWSLENEMWLEEQMKAEGNGTCSSPTKGVSPGESQLEALLTSKSEKRNMLLLLLVCSLIFSIPYELMKATLDMTKLTKLADVDVVKYFLVAPESRAKLSCLLLSATILDKDMRIDGGLYPKLFRCLDHTCRQLFQLANSNPNDDVKTFLNDLPSEGFRPYVNQIRKDLRINRGSQSSQIEEKFGNLLAVELSQLLCLVPTFIGFIVQDSGDGLINLLQLSTRDDEIFDRLMDVVRQMEVDGMKESWEVYRKVTSFLLEKISKNNDAKEGHIQMLEQDSVFDSEHQYKKRNSLRVQTAVTRPSPRHQDRSINRTGNNRQRAKTAPLNRVNTNTKVAVGDTVDLGSDDVEGRVLSITDKSIVTVLKLNPRSDETSQHLGAEVEHIPIKHLTRDEMGRKWIVSSRKLAVPLQGLQPYVVGGPNAEGSSFLIASGNFVNKMNANRAKVWGHKGDQWQEVKKKRNVRPVKKLPNLNLSTFDKNSKTGQMLETLRGVSTSPKEYQSEGRRSTEDKPQRVLSPMSPEPPQNGSVTVVIRDSLNVTDNDLETSSSEDEDDDILWTATPAGVGLHSRPGSAKSKSSRVPTVYRPGSASSRPGSAGRPQRPGSANKNNPTEIEPARTVSVIISGQSEVISEKNTQSIPASEVKADDSHSDVAASECKADNSPSLPKVTGDDTLITDADVTPKAPVTIIPSSKAVGIKKSSLADAFTMSKPPSNSDPPKYRLNYTQKYNSRHQSTSKKNHSQYRASSKTVQFDIELPTKKNRNRSNTVRSTLPDTQRLPPWMSLSESALFRQSKSIFLHD